MTVIQRIITCRAYLLTYFKKEVMNMHDEAWTEEDANAMKPHGITCESISALNDIEEPKVKGTTMQNLGKMNSRWNNTRPMLQIVLATYRNWFWWHRVFVKIQDGKIPDCAAAKRLTVYQKAQGNCFHTF
jgi:hypothetical protein